jgi:hypothetical protein
MLTAMLAAGRRSARSAGWALMLAPALLALPGPAPAQVLAAPFVLYPHPGACLGYAGCAGPWWDHRRQPRRPVAPEPAAPADPDIWGSTGSPWGYVRRLPPPTPEAQIQPRYRDAGTIRPEFIQRAEPTAQ